MEYTLFDSPVGILTLVSEGGRLIGLYFGEKALGTRGTNSVLEGTAHQLDEYFSGRRREFDLPLEMRGTDFRKAVWTQLLGIPYGETRSYGEIAAGVGSPKAVRAVGNANHHNPISIIVPCHRVVGYNGALTGYGGGLDKKRILLELESRFRN